MRQAANQCLLNECTTEQGTGVGGGVQRHSELLGQLVPLWREKSPWGPLRSSLEPSVARRTQVWAWEIVTSHQVKHLVPQAACSFQAET